MSIIQVRALDSNWDILSGNGSANFLTDIDAVAQILKSTILLLQGEFFLNTASGTPLFQELLSHPITNNAVALILQNIILGVPYVTSIASMSVTYAPNARSFSFNALVQTLFGPITLSA